MYSLNHFYLTSYLWQCPCLKVTPYALLLYGRMPFLLATKIKYPRLGLEACDSCVFNCLFSAKKALETSNDFQFQLAGALHLRVSEVLDLGVNFNSRLNF